MRSSFGGGARQRRGWRPVGGARFPWEMLGGWRSASGRGGRLETRGCASKVTVTPCPVSEPRRTERVLDRVRPNLGLDG